MDVILECDGTVVGQQICAGRGSKLGGIRKNLFRKLWWIRGESGSG